MLVLARRNPGALTNECVLLIEVETACNRRQAYVGAVYLEDCLLKPRGEVEALSRIVAERQAHPSLNVR